MSRNRYLGYPDTPLKEQVRPYNDTQSVWDVVIEHFGLNAENEPEKDNGNH